MEFWKLIQEYVSPFSVTHYSTLVCLKDGTEKTAMTFASWIGTISCEDQIFCKHEVSHDPQNVACFIPLRYLEELKDKLIAACGALTTPEKIAFAVYDDV